MTPTPPVSAELIAPDTAALADLEDLISALNDGVVWLDAPVYSIVNEAETDRIMRWAASALATSLDALAASAAREERMREALEKLRNACLAADAAEELSDHVDGSLLDEAGDILGEQYPVIWTPEQVALLEARQADGAMHPYTCGNDRSDQAHTDQAIEDGEEHQPGKLIPTQRGWVCPACEYRQFWSHETRTALSQEAET